MAATAQRADGVALARVAPAEPAATGSTACRLLDLTLSLVLAILLLPVLALIAGLIKLDSSGPVLYRQRRVGLGLSEFTICKFRTMHEATSIAPHREYVLGLIRNAASGSQPHPDASLYKLANDDRITRVGRALRRFSLDELPQLWNVLRGEMSLVGPRPAIPYEVDSYPDDWCRRFTVMPGMTGLWQVRGRCQLDLRRMVELDLEYTERRSLWLNLRILARTPWVVLNGKGAA
jgi:lipopolysaccharide/colanic/teichoic acid biosynthesis glycosyltransferase